MDLITTKELELMDQSSDIVVKERLHQYEICWILYFADRFNVTALLLHHGTSTFAYGNVFFLALAL